MPKHKGQPSSPRRHERRLRSYERQPGKRAPGRCILIVCEGAETEPNYFNSLREYLKLSTVQVKVKERGGAPITVINQAQAQVEKRQQEVREGQSNVSAFESICCVLDVENPHENPSFERAIQNADQSGYQLAVSNPAFEFWYILHFEHTTRPFVNANEVKQYLQRHIRDYREAMSVFELLVRSTRQAIDRARSIAENHPQGTQRFPNPSTQVYLPVEEMIEMSPSGREHLR